MVSKNSITFVGTKAATKEIDMKQSRTARVLALAHLEMKNVEAAKSAIEVSMKVQCCRCLSILNWFAFFSRASAVLLVPS